MSVNDNKIVEILDKYEDTMRKAGAFLLEVDENELFITDSCEGVDMVQLDKDMCNKLADLFRELSDTL